MDTKYRKEYINKDGKYKELLDRLNVIAYEFDVSHHCFVYVSKPAEAILGYPLEEWKQEGFWYTHLHPDDRQRAAEFSRLYTKLNKDHEFEYRMIASDGSIKWFKDITSVKSENGIPGTLQGVLVDITDQMLAEESMKKSEERLSAIFENAPIGNIFADTFGNFLRVNKAICEMLGYSQEEMLKLNFVDITHPDDIDKTVENIESTKGHKHGSFTMEKRYLRKDGTAVNVLLHFNILYNAAGEAEYYIAQIIDVTEKKRSEEKLRETQLKLSSLFDNLHDVVFYETNGEGTFITDNVSELLGYTSKELSGTNGLFLSLVHPDDSQKVRDTYKMWRKIEENAFSQLEVRLKRKDGEYIWVEDRMFAVTTPERSYWAGFMIDITDRKNSEKKLAVTEHRLSSILNNLSNIVFYENEDRLMFISENIYEMLGYKAEEFYSDKDMFSKIVHPSDFRRVYSKINEWFKKGEEGSIKSEFRIRRNDGTYIWVEDIMFTVVTGERKYWTGFFIDVSERKKAEEKLQETGKRLTTIVDNLTNLTVYETGGGKNYISENIEKLTGIPRQKFLDDINLFGNLIYPDDAHQMEKKVLDWYKTGAKGVLSSEFRLKKENGEHVWIEDHMFMIKNGSEIDYLSGILIDITETKNTLEKMRDTEIRLSTVLNNLPKIVIYQSGKGKDFISENITDMTGYLPGEIFKEKYFFGKIMHPDDLKTVKENLREWKKIKNQDDVLNMEYRLKKKDGEYIWLEDHMFRVSPDGAEPYLSGILIDITERKLAEQKITQSLQEKEVLLKEIHHRVKNNLQVISSLLKLQSHYLKDNQASNILLESQNRVRSMALVHQKLYQSKDFAKIDFSDYVQQLTINLINIYRLNNRYVQLNVKSDEIFIGIDVAVPCGLIINEIVSNALKYAFNGHDDGRLDITLNNSNDGYFSFTISDNGIGFPKNVDFRKTQSLGLQLVNTLVNQIDGTIELDSSCGTSFTVKFKDYSEPKERYSLT